MDEIIFVIDDDPSIRRSLSLLLQSFNYEVETFSSSEEFLAREYFDGIGCIILDLNLSGKSGLELQEELLKRSYHLPIVFITGKGEIPQSVQALRRGAVDFLQKPFDDKQILKSIKDAISKAYTIKNEYEQFKQAHTLVDQLTRRETEVLKYIVIGMLNKKIAYELNISEQTVKLHRGKITQKLGVKSVAELVHLSRKAGVQIPSIEHHKSHSR